MRVNQPDRRATTRVSLEAEFMVRKAGGFAFQLRALNASSGGCRVELVEMIESGERVIVRLPALEPLAAGVAWSDGNRAGLQFQRPLHPAVFDHLMDRCAACAA